MIKAIKAISENITGYKSGLNIVVLGFFGILVGLTFIVFAIGTFTQINVNGQVFMDLLKTTFPIPMLVLGTTFGLSATDVITDKMKQGGQE